MILDRSKISRDDKRLNETSVNGKGHAVKQPVASIFVVCKCIVCKRLYGPQEPLILKIASEIVNDAPKAVRLGLRRGGKLPFFKELFTMIDALSLTAWTRPGFGIMV
jgi:hypothetical protein